MDPCLIASKLYTLLLDILHIIVSSFSEGQVMVIPVRVAGCVTEAQHPAQGLLPVL